MSLLLGERLGSQEPVIQHLPPDVHSLAAAEEAIELADAYGVCDGNPLAESQKITLRAGLGERADGSWAASRIGDFGPRQGTGKNDKIAARELAGLVLFGERLIIHTAHEFPTANESFLRLVAVFENHDDLRRRVARIRYANGEQGIEFLTGQRLKYRARTGGSGRGFAKADLVVYDEAQHLARSHVAASGPAKLANPNSQSWYAGSGGFSNSSVAWEMRRAAILGTGGRLAYTEMTGETITVVNGRIKSIPPDPSDRDAWYRCMPGLGRWVTEEGMVTLAEELGAEFSREGMCVWDPEPGSDTTTLPGWTDALDSRSGPVGNVAFGLDASPGLTSASIVVAALSGLGGTHLEITSDEDQMMDARPGTYWVIERAKALQKRWHGTFAVAKGSPAAAMVKSLTDAGVRVVEVSVDEHLKACGQLEAAVAQGQVWHLGQPELDAAISGARQKPHGDAWLWDRRHSNADITPIVAAGLAKWALENTTVATPGFVNLDDLIDD